MPTAGGPNILGENNLVFAYDTGDTGNSYKGQPTVNVLPSSNALLTSYNDHGGTHITDTGFTLFGNATLRNISNPAQDWNGVYLTGLSSILTPGVTYTYSFYIYFTGDNTTISYFGYGAPGYTGVKGKWNRVSTTFTATTQDHFYVTLQYSNGQPVSTYYLANLQIEAKSYPTPFVNGTRSNTQGLLPLVGNNTIDLTNVSFDSNAQITFDGTDDYFTTTTTPSSLQGNSTFSVEGIFKRSGDIIQQGFWGIGGGTTLQGICSWNYILTNEIGIDLWGTSTYGTGQTYSSTEWKHIVWTYNGTSFTTSNISIFVNGVKYTGGNLITRRGGSGTPNINNSGITLGRIHSGTAGYHASGQVPVYKVYNKVLSDSEVKQNYQQYKTRFNLS